MQLAQSFVVVDKLRLGQPHAYAFHRESTFCKLLTGSEREGSPDQQHMLKNITTTQSAIVQQTNARAKCAIGPQKIIVVSELIVLVSLTKF